MSRKWIDAIVFAVVGLQIFTLLAAISLESNANASAVSGTCCTPAHIVTQPPPAPPPGAGQSCAVDPTTNQCANIAGQMTCTGTAWPNYAPGNCNTPSKNANCTLGVFTSLTETDGTFKCVSNGFVCVCQWFQNVPGTQRTVDNIANCSGDGC